MRVVGFDPAVAEAHGYRIVNLSDGRQASIPQSKVAAAQSGDYRPLGNQTEWGDCGNSFIEFNGTGSNLQAYLRTGFYSNIPAIAWTWLVEIDDTAGTSYQSYGGALAGQNEWSSSEDLRTLTYGIATGFVVADRSNATTLAGTVCSSLGPVTTTAIT